MSVKQYFMKAVLISFSSLSFWAFLLLLPSCGSFKNASNSRVGNENIIDYLEYDKNITEKYWKLTEIMGNDIIVSDSGEPYLILKTDGSINAYSGCNKLSGRYELKEPNGIIFFQTATTDKVCPDMETEASFLTVLQSATGYRLNKDTLILKTSERELAAKFEVVYF